MSQMKRVLALVLVFAMLFTLLPVEAIAATAETEPNASNELSVIEFLHDTGAQNESDAIVIEDIASFQSQKNEVLPNSALEFETTISGIVQDENGSGISRVAVTIYDITNDDYLYTKCTTDASGAWIIEDAWIGDTYLVAYYKAGYEFSSNHIVVTAQDGGTVLETVIATPLEIDGLVCNEADYTYTTDVTTETATITGYTGTDVAIQLPSELGGYPVVSISGSVFKSNTTIETVVFSENIISIGESAFSGCTNLKEVYLPNTLTKIYNQAFQGCTRIERMLLP